MTFNSFFIACGYLLGVSLWAWEPCCNWQQLAGLLWLADDLMTMYQLRWPTQPGIVLAVKTDAVEEGVLSGDFSWCVGDYGSRFTSGDCALTLASSFDWGLVLTSTFLSSTATSSGLQQAVGLWCSLSCPQILDFLLNWEWICAVDVFMPASVSMVRTRQFLVYLASCLRSYLSSFINSNGSINRCLV